MMAANQKRSPYRWDCKFESWWSHGPSVDRSKESKTVCAMWVGWTAYTVFCVNQRNPNQLQTSVSSRTCKEDSNFLRACYKAMWSSMSSCLKRYEDGFTCRRFGPPLPGWWLSCDSGWELAKLTKLGREWEKFQKLHLCTVIMLTTSTHWKWKPMAHIQAMIISVPNWVLKFF